MTSSLMLLPASLMLHTDAGPASLLHVVATEALDACIDASGGAAMSQHIDDHFAQALTQAAGGAEQAQRLLQCVRAAERHAAAEHQVQEQQQQQQQQPLDDTFEPATAAVLFGVASGLDDQGHAAMQALLQAQPSLVFWRLCLRAYACLQGVCLA
ncbi:hypothetical protein DUNSADRAFT_10238 [Dunaliella salina]|uniref:Uncharacterized protein n=1 Tax=Dunaliella salina TaxID=3046 RepID=A0ABQ7GFQ8_DUNSA|nr:hypothetical protein DUNSADRAFT_10238 [Dunaliella salina]|eukprot:KAF5833448.1 hypothetical protein DUNSADRAFT_10238 [Dunaliella salina]